MDDGSGEKSSNHNHTSQVSQEQLRREAKIKVRVSSWRNICEVMVGLQINYRSLLDNFRSLERDEMKEKIDRMAKEISEGQEQIGKMQAPNLKANER